MFKNSSKTCRTWFAVFALLSGVPAIYAAPAYNPKVIEQEFKPATLDLTINDSARQRAIPVRVYLPVSTDAVPVVLFSHGLGGSRENNGFLGRHWAGRGYVSVFMQHSGSDESVWKDKPLRQIMPAMQQAANGENFRLRTGDVKAVLDQLERWNEQQGHALWHRLNLKKVGMSGHSFGAVTTQAVSGQAFPFGQTSATDPRITAACMFSPSSPRVGNAAQAFGSVKIPWMVMTGTEDVAPIGDTDLASRLAVFPALPPGDKYELVLKGAKHSAFGEHGQTRMRGQANPNHHQVILALTTAFWDAYLKGNADAKVWLTGTGPQSVLEEGDRWQKK